eukprot:g77057.t1
MSSRALTSVSVSDRSYHLKGEALAASNPLPHASLAIALHKPLKAASVGGAGRSSRSLIASNLLPRYWTSCPDVETSQWHHVSGTTNCQLKPWPAGTDRSSRCNHLQKCKSHVLVGD